MPPLLSAESLVTLVTNVTRTMFGFSFRLGESARGARLRYRVALLTIGAQTPVTVALATDEPGARALGGSMFQCPPAEVDLSMAEDSMCELVNMTAGQIKSALSLDAALGLPRVTDPARVLRAASRWERVTLRAEPMELEVWLSIEPSDWSEHHP